MFQSFRRTGHHKTFPLRDHVQAEIPNIFTFKSKFRKGFVLSLTMNTSTYIHLLATASALALVACAHTPQSTRLPVSATVSPKKSTTGSLFNDVNAYRRSQGKAELQRHGGLDRLAQEHSEYLRRNRGSFKLNGRNVSHFGFEGRALVARERYQMENVSENVAAALNPGSTDAATLLNLWKNSKDHHKNMLDSWTHSGMGVVVDSDGMVFATQLFSTVSMSQMSVRERFNRF